MRGHREEAVPLSMDHAQVPERAGLPGSDLARSVEKAGSRDTVPAPLDARAEPHGNDPSLAGSSPSVVGRQHAVGTAAAVTTGPPGGQDTPETVECLLVEAYLPVEGCLRAGGRMDSGLAHTGVRRMDWECSGKRLKMIDARAHPDALGHGRHHMPGRLRLFAPKVQRAEVGSSLTADEPSQPYLVMCEPRILQLEGSHSHSNKNPRSWWAAHIPNLSSQAHTNSASRPLLEARELHMKASRLPCRTIPAWETNPKDSHMTNVLSRSAALEPPVRAHCCAIALDPCLR